MTSPFGASRSAALSDPFSTSSARLAPSTPRSVLPPHDRPFHLTDVWLQAFKQSTVRPRPSDSNARHSMWTSVKTADRSSSPLGSNARHLMWSSVQTKDRSSSPFGFGRSTLNVDERSSNPGVRPRLRIRTLESLCASVLAVGRSTSKIFDHTSTRALVNPCQRASKYRSSTHFNERSSTHVNERPNIARQPMSTSARQTHVIERSITARQSLSTSARQTDVIERSNTARQSISTSARHTHVNERSNTARQSLGTSVQAVGRSASKVFALSVSRMLDIQRLHTLLDVCHVRSLGLNVRPSVASTIRSPVSITFGHLWPRPFDYPSHRRSATWHGPYDLSYKRSAFRLRGRSTIHGYERFNLRPLDANDVRSLGANRSAIRSHGRSAWSVRHFAHHRRSAWSVRHFAHHKRSPRAFVTSLIIDNAKGNATAQEASHQLQFHASSRSKNTDSSLEAWRLQLIGEEEHPAWLQVQQASNSSRLSVSQSSNLHQSSTLEKMYAEKKKAQSWKELMRFNWLDGRNNNT
ncbi:hypothetical protein LR48_Vigan10g192400 [Vigna angularis]|uniref:Uncharacterized protein n=1 Tax=Phaseolus angularis TaxID=3914 RepID=A0A0L9VMD1_PHAAN|nr:hypothetical protein LR48_Vigan10g192400 [Vigna angularis]